MFDPIQVKRFFQDTAKKTGDQIEINSGIYGGSPCIAGTRVPVYAILEMIREGYGHKKVIKAFPSIGNSELDAAFRFCILIMGGEDHV